MANASGIRAGKAYVEIGTNTSALEKGLRAVQQRLRSFGKGLTIAGGAMAGAATAVLGPMIASAGVFAKSGDELSKMADKTGASVESLSELRHAATQSAVDFDQLGKAMARQQKTIGDAAGGNKMAQESLAAIGTTAEELMQLSPDKQFELIADRIAAISDPAMRATAAMDIFGRSGVELMPLMIGGASAIQTLRKEARDLGLQMSSKDAKAATKLGDTWAIVQKTMKQVSVMIGAALAPALTSIMEAVIPLITGVIRWVDSNRQLVVTIAGIAAAVGAAGLALTAVGGTMVVLSVAVGGLITLGGVLATIFGALVSPIGLVVAAVVGAAAAFLTMTDAGKATVGWFGKEFGKLSKIVGDTMGGILDAFAGGRLGLAAKIAFTGFKLAMATILDDTLALFGASTKSMIAMAGDVHKAWAMAKAGAADIGDEIGTDMAVHQGKQELNRQFLNLHEKHRKAGTLDSDEYKREKELLGNAKLDVEKSADAAREVFRENLRKELNAELEAIDQATARAIEAMDIDGIQAELDRLKLLASHRPGEHGGGAGIHSVGTGGIAFAASQLAKSKEGGGGGLSAFGLLMMANAATGIGQLMANVSALPDVMSKYTSAGGFNAAGLQGLGADNLAARTAKASEQAAQLLTRIEGNTRQGLKFG